MVRQVPLQNDHAVVKSLAQAHPLDQRLQHPKTTTVNPFDTTRHLVADVPGLQDRGRSLWLPAPIQTISGLPLTSSQICLTLLHLKRLSFRGWFAFAKLRIPRRIRRFYILGRLRRRSTCWIWD